MTTTLVPDTRTDRHAIARGLLEVDVLDHEARLWRELADFLAEPLALHNLLATGDHAQRRQREQILRGIFNETRTDAVNLSLHVNEPRPNAEDCPRCEAENRNLPYPFICPGHDTLGARVRASIEPEPEPDPDPLPILTDVVARRGGKYRRTDRPSLLQRLRDAWADETGAPA